MRINKWWKVHKWLPVILAMPKMIKELEADPSSGFLGYTGFMGTTIMQYWKSFDHLEAYARNPDKSHWPAWTDFNRRMKGSLGDVGIWHETYVISPGQFEAIYSGMPIKKTTNSPSISTVIRRSTTFAISPSRYRKNPKRRFVRL